MTYGAKTFSSISSAGNINTSQNRKRNVPPLHVLSISAAVTRIRWRPVANVSWSNGDDLHDSMIAVSTAPIKGTNAGGAGTLSLWSFYRPYMPLSIVEGHQDGAVVDFDWLETPQLSSATYFPTDAPSKGIQSNEMGSFFVEDGHRARIWQHVISVGRDGNCLVQSLVRGAASWNIMSTVLICDMFLGPTI
jgi:WD repeat-containing protein 24